MPAMAKSSAAIALAGQRSETVGPQLTQPVTVASQRLGRPGPGPHRRPDPGGRRRGRGGGQRRRRRLSARAGCAAR